MSSYNIFISYIYRPSSWKEKKNNSPFSTQLFIQDLQYKAREPNIILDSSAETRLEIHKKLSQLHKWQVQNS